MSLLLALSTLSSRAEHSKTLSCVSRHKHSLTAAKQCHRTSHQSHWQGSSTPVHRQCTVCMGHSTLLLRTAGQLSDPLSRQADSLTGDCSSQHCRNLALALLRLHKPARRDCRYLCLRCTHQSIASILSYIRCLNCTVGKPSCRAWAGKHCLLPLNVVTDSGRLPSYSLYTFVV